MERKIKKSLVQKWEGQAWENPTEQGWARGGLPTDGNQEGFRFNLPLSSAAEMPFKDFASSENTAVSWCFLEEIRKFFKGSLRKSLVATMLMPCGLPEVFRLFVLGRVGCASHQTYEAVWEKSSRNLGVGGSSGPQPTSVSQHRVFSESGDLLFDEKFQNDHSFVVRKSTMLPKDFH